MKIREHVAREALSAEPRLASRMSQIEMDRSVISGTGGGGGGGGAPGGRGGGGGGGGVGAGRRDTPQQC